MSVSLIKAPVTPETLPDLDPALGAALGDEILLSAARSTKIARVNGGNQRTLTRELQRSHSARAWTARGSVD
jgi:hypothetical protein